MIGSTDTASHPTPDSYDAHIVPSETAARKKREGDHYKQVPVNQEGVGSIDTTGGYTVDKEGLANNFAIEPEMYTETPGDLHIPVDNAGETYAYTVVDIFPSPASAVEAVLQMQNAGLDTNRISILGKNYQDTDHVHGNLSWKDIDQANGLAAVLTDLGISRHDALKYEAAIESDHFVVLVTGSSEDVSQANNILHDIGHKNRLESSNSHLA